MGRLSPARGPQGGRRSGLRVCVHACMGAVGGEWAARPASEAGGGEDETRPVWWAARLSSVLCRCCRRVADRDRRSHVAAAWPRYRSARTSAQGRMSRPHTHTHTHTHEARAHTGTHRHTQAHTRTRRSRPLSAPTHAHAPAVGGKLGVVVDVRGLVGRKVAQGAALGQRQHLQRAAGGDGPQLQHLPLWEGQRGCCGRQAEQRGRAQEGEQRSGHGGRKEGRKGGRKEG